MGARQSTQATNSQQPSDYATNTSTPDNNRSNLTVMGNPSPTAGTSNSSSLSGLSFGPQTFHRLSTRNILSNSTRNILNTYPHSNSEDSSPDEPPFNRLFLSHLFALRDIKCPACQKMIRSDNIECHLVMCLSKPFINYNEDILGEDKGECSICLEDLKQGDVIARLPCLCVYHKSCIDSWFQVKRSCPEHPND